NMLIGYAYPKMLILRNKKNGLLNDLGSIWLCLLLLIKPRFRSLLFKKNNMGLAAI
ncbi:hypothetical protein ACJX0J_019671, partial [Zea mays]